MPKVLITTVPFSDKSRVPIELLENANIDYLINPIGRKLREDELAEMVKDFDVLIAGTELITDKVLSRATKLKFISRVGVGLDGVDLLSAKRRGIGVSYTPEAPAPAVSELTIGLMFSLLRHIHLANTSMHRQEWHRLFGRRISEVIIGVIGVGRIGGDVVHKLSALGARRILVNDLHFNASKFNGLNLELVDKNIIYAEADLISLHVPLTNLTQNMIGHKELKTMKSDAMIINTSRGGVINEADLVNVLNYGHLAGAAIDVFDEEPYFGPLSKVERCILTSHMGSMSIDCRSAMEEEATREAIRFLKGQPLVNLVPQVEYDIRGQV